MIYIIITIINKIFIIIVLLLLLLLLHDYIVELLSQLYKIEQIYVYKISVISMTL